MSNPLSRFQPRASVSTRPGCCFICRGINGPFIDTQTTIDYEGAVYICFTCVEQMYEQCDFPVEPVQDRYPDGFKAGVEAGQQHTIEGLYEYLVSRAVPVLPAITLTAQSSDSLEDSDGGSQSTGKSGDKSDTKSDANNIGLEPVGKSSGKSGRNNVSSVTSHDPLADITI